MEGAGEKKQPYGGGCSGVGTVVFWRKGVQGDFIK